MKVPNTYNENIMLLFEWLINYNTVNYAECGNNWSRENFTSLIIFLLRETLLYFYEFDGTWKSFRVGEFSSITQSALDRVHCIVEGNTLIFKMYNFRSIYCSLPSSCIWTNRLFGIIALFFECYAHCNYIRWFRISYNCFPVC